MGKNIHTIKIYEKCLEENFDQVIMVLQQSSHHKPICIKQAFKRNWTRNQCKTIITEIWQANEVSPMTNTFTQTLFLHNMWIKEEISKEVQNFKFIHFKLNENENMTY